MALAHTNLTHAPSDPEPAIAVEPPTITFRHGTAVVAEMAAGLLVEIPPDERYAWPRGSSKRVRTPNLRIAPT